MRYSPEGFIPGVVIGIGCIGVLVALYILERRRAGKSHR
jgi:predicted ThiF/HesA family dinucleotide-utilizing enzyme